jgi:hypothetical protein
LVLRLARVLSTGTNKEGIRLASCHELVVTREGIRPENL